MKTRSSLSPWRALGGAALLSGGVALAVFVLFTAPADRPYSWRAWILPDVLIIAAILALAWGVILLTVPTKKPRRKLTTRQVEFCCWPLGSAIPPWRS